MTTDVFNVDPGLSDPERFERQLHQLA
ncbi:MAG: hypothetical protein QOE57_3496, partial [Acidimicrobiaceae bacterium]|nr:hypothetical protein [Acidimicrobiaceae bacterium]